MPNTHRTTPPEARCCSRLSNAVVSVISFTAILWHLSGELDAVRRHHAQGTMFWIGFAYFLSRP